jgi:hypothetical protein
MLTSAVQGQDALVTVSQLIRTGHIPKLVEMFDESVEITVLNDEGTYSKAQAEEVIKDFYIKHRPKEFKLMHKGESDGGSKYGIARFVTTNGTFRTSFYIKKKESGYVIQKLAFEEY